MKQSAYRHWVTVLLMTATITVMFGFGRNVMVVTWPSVIDRFAITYADVGNLTAAHQGAYLLGSLLAGRMAVSVRPELLVSLSTVVGGALILLVGVVSDYALLSVIYASLGLLIALAWVPMVRFVALTMDKAQRVAALSIAACGTALGFLVNGFIIPPVMERYGFAELWATLGAITVLVGIASYGAFASQRRASSHSTFLNGGTPFDEPSGRSDFPALRFYSVLFLCGMGLVSFQTYYSAYLVEDLRVTQAAAAQAWILPGVLGAASGLFLTLIANRSSIKTTIQLCLVVLGSAYMALLMAGSDDVAFIAGAFYGLFYFGLFGLFPALLANLMAARSASIVFGRANLFLGAGSVIGGAAGGRIVHQLGSFDLFWLLSTAAILLAALLMLPMPSDRDSTA